MKNIVKSLFKLNTGVFMFIPAILIGISLMIAFSGHWLLFWQRSFRVQMLLLSAMGGVFSIGMLHFLDRFFIPCIRLFRIWLTAVLLAVCAIVSVLFVNNAIDYQPQAKDLQNHTIKISPQSDGSILETVRIMQIEANGEEISNENISCAENCRLEGDEWQLSGNGSLTLFLTTSSSRPNSIEIRFLQDFKSGTAVIALDDQPAEEYRKITLTNAGQDFIWTKVEIPASLSARLLRANDYLALTLMFFFIFVTALWVWKKYKESIYQFVERCLDGWEHAGAWLTQVWEWSKRVPVWVYFVPLVLVFAWSMAVSVNPWALGYVCGYAVLAIGLGMAVYYLPRAFPLPGVARFLAGASLSPFLIGGWMLGVVYLWPGVPRTVAAGGPLAIGLGLVALLGRRFGGRLRRAWVRHGTSLRSFPRLAFLLAVTYLLGGLVIQILQNTDLPIIDHDAVFYFSEAAPLARYRVPEAIQGITDAPDGTHRRDYHTFFFPALIAHGLLVSPETPGPANDYAARAGLQVNVVLMLAALGALGFSLKKSGFWVGLLGLFIYFPFPLLGFLSYGHGRDAYRTIPLLLFVSLLVANSPPERWRRVGWPMLGGIFVVVGCVVHGHIVGLMNLALICMAWGLWMLLARAPWRLFLQIGGTVLASVLINGERIFAFVVYYFQVERFAISAPPSEPLAPYFTRLIAMFDRGGLGFTITALLLCLGYVVWGLFIRRKWDGSLFLLSLISLVSLSFLAPVYQPLMGMTLEDLFLRNFRYTLHWFPLASVVLAIMLVEIIRIVRRTRLGRALGTLVLAVGFVAWSGLVVQNLREIDRDNLNYDKEYFKIVSDFKSVLKRLPEGKYLLTNEDRYTYYLDNEPIMLLTSVAYTLRTTNDEAVVRSELQRLNIGAVVWGHFDDKYWRWADSAVYRYTMKPENRYQFFKKIYDVGEFEADIVDPTIKSRFD